MDEFERDLKIRQLEKSYDAASDALRRAQMTLQVLRAEVPASKSISAAERRCAELEGKRLQLRRSLEELEEQDDAEIPRRRSGSSARLGAEPRRSPR